MRSLTNVLLCSVLLLALGAGTLYGQQEPSDQGMVPEEKSQEEKEILEKVPQEDYPPEEEVDGEREEIPEETGEGEPLLSEETPEEEELPDEEEMVEEILPDEESETSKDGKDLQQPATYYHFDLDTEYGEVKIDVYLEKGQDPEQALVGIARELSEFLEYAEETGEEMPERPKVEPQPQVAQQQDLPAGNLSSEELHEALARHQEEMDTRISEFEEKVATWMHLLREKTHQDLQAHHQVMNKKLARHHMDLEKHHQKIESTLAKRYDKMKKLANGLKRFLVKRWLLHKKQAKKWHTRKKHPHPRWKRWKRWQNRDRDKNEDRYDRRERYDDYDRYDDQQRYGTRERYRDYDDYYDREDRRYQRRWYHNDRYRDEYDRDRWDDDERDW